MQVLGKPLIALGVLFVLVGLVLNFLPAIPFLGKLPGDIRIERPGFRLYFPITTSVILSLALSLLLYLFSKLR